MRRASWAYGNPCKNEDVPNGGDAKSLIERSIGVKRQRAPAHRDFKGIVKVFGILAETGSGASVTRMGRMLTFEGAPAGAGKKYGTGSAPARCTLLPGERGDTGDWIT